MRTFHNIFHFAFVLYLFGLAKCDVNEFEECFKKDSISCLQLQFFRHAKQFMNQDSIDLVEGLSLEKEGEEGANRSGKSLELLEMEQRVENATDIVSRQEAIENFVVRKARDVVLEKTIRWDVGQTLRNILIGIPQTIKAKFTNYVTEARGKGKKLFRFLVPLLIGLKLKMAGLAAITYLGVALLAKKALLASLISIIVSGFIGLKKLLAAKQAPYEDVAYHHPVPAWAPAPVYDSHPDYAAQKIAYNARITS